MMHGRLSIIESSCMAASGRFLPVLKGYRQPEMDIRLRENS